MASAELTWFTEVELPDSRPGVRIGLQVRQMLVDEQSQWGRLQVLDTVFFGRTLVIDGIVQVTESDEFIYHEMMVLLPALQHGSAKRVLIAGGGDGGALRQGLRLPGLVGLTQVEIDDRVSQLCREYLPSVSDGAFDHPLPTMVWQDAYEFLAESNEQFDVIALDLTDPVPGGPAERLFGEEFLAVVAQRLTPNGIVMMQSGSLVIQPAEIARQYARMRTIFADVRLHHAVVPCYQLTSFGFLMASQRPLSVLSREEFERRLASVSGDNQYLNYETYQASMALSPTQQELLVGRRGS